MDNYYNDHWKRFKSCKLGKNIVASGFYSTGVNNFKLCFSLNNSGFSLNSSGFSLNSSDLYSFGFNSSSLYSSDS